MISINPIDRLVIDLSYKINAIGGWYNSEYGKNLFMNEISMNLRYSIMLFSFQYNFGNITYDNFESSNPDHIVDVSTIRVMLGFKF